MEINHNFFIYCSINVLCELFTLKNDATDRIFFSFFFLFSFKKLPRNCIFCHFQLDFFIKKLEISIKDYNMQTF